MFKNIDIERLPKYENVTRFKSTWEESMGAIFIGIIKSAQF